MVCICVCPLSIAPGSSLHCYKHSVMSNSFLIVSSLRYLSSEGALE